MILTRSPVISWPQSTHQWCVWRRVWRGVPPYRLVDVDIVHKEGNEVAEEKMELEQHVAIHRQLGDLTVLQRDHRLRSQRGAGHARPRTIPADKAEDADYTGEAVYYEAYCFFKATFPDSLTSYEIAPQWQGSWSSGCRCWPSPAHCLVGVCSTWYGSPLSFHQPSQTHPRLTSLRCVSSFMMSLLVLGTCLHEGSWSDALTVRVDLLHSTYT